MDLIDLILRFVGGQVLLFIVQMWIDVAIICHFWQNSE